MKEYITKKEYDEIISEKKKFERLYRILKIDSLEIIVNLEKEEISYFCIATSKENTYITFYSADSRDLIQVLLSKNINVSDIFDKKLITEVNVDKPEDNYYYKGYKFNYLEEPYFIKQIFTDINLKDTDLIKELEEEIEYYKDKIIEENEELYNYSITNSILNKYKFELEAEKNEINQIV